MSSSSSLFMLSVMTRFFGRPLSSEQHYPFRVGLVCILFFFQSPHLLMFQHLILHLFFRFPSHCFSFHNILYFRFRSIVFIFRFPSSSFWFTRCTFYYFGFRFTCLLFSSTIFSFLISCDCFFI